MPITYSNDCECCLPPPFTGTNPATGCCSGVTIPPILYLRCTFVFRSTGEGISGIGTGSNPPQIVQTCRCCIPLYNSVGSARWQNLLGGSNYGTGTGLTPGTPWLFLPVELPGSGISEFRPAIWLECYSGLSWILQMVTSTNSDYPNYYTTIHYATSGGPDSPPGGTCSPFDLDIVDYAGGFAAGELGPISIIRDHSYNVTMTDWSITETPCGPDENPCLITCGDGGTGTGTGTGTDDTVLVSCCDVPIKKRLYITATGCTCLTDMHRLDYDSVSGRWLSNPADVVNCGGAGFQEFVLECIGEGSNTWTLSAFCGGAEEFVASGQTETSCDPFLLEIFAVLGTGACCGFSGANFTITETPP